MAVALACMGPVFPRWALTFDATEEEQAEALAAFGEPYNVVGSAQIQIGREESHDPKFAHWHRAPWVYTARKVSWDLCGPVRAATIAGLVEACPRFAQRTS